MVVVSWGVEVGIGWKRAQGNFLEYWKCGLHKSMHFSKAWFVYFMLRKSNFNKGIYTSVKL